MFENENSAGRFGADLDSCHEVGLLLFPGPNDLGRSSGKVDLPYVALWRPRHGNIVSVSPSRGEHPALVFKTEQLIGFHFLQLSWIGLLECRIVGNVLPAEDFAIAAIRDIEK